MDIKKIFMVLVDISGYTRFIKVHKISLLHAELIIDELLESVIKESRTPLILHELEGDAVNFYAESDGRAETARDISRQVERFIEAFRKRERELVSECSLCFCDACTQIGRLKLKAIVHHGSAVFTRIRQFNKISGEDVILAHRLLKNSIEHDEYLLFTEACHRMGGVLEGKTPEARSEDCDGLGRVNVMVYYLHDDSRDKVPAKISLGRRLKMFTRLEGHFFKRLLRPSAKRYRNLEAGQRIDGPLLVHGE